METALPMILSFQLNHPIVWAIAHGMCSWFYVIWRASRSCASRTGKPVSASTWMSGRGNDDYTSVARDAAAHYLCRGGRRSRRSVSLDRSGRRRKTPLKSALARGEAVRLPPTQRAWGSGNASGAPRRQRAAFWLRAEMRGGLHFRLDTPG